MVVVGGASPLANLSQQHAKPKPSLLANSALSLLSCPCAPGGLSSPIFRVKESGHRAAGISWNPTYTALTWSMGGGHSPLRLTL